MSGHLNYAWWGPVAVAEANLIKETKPMIHEALANGHGTVHHPTRPFSGIWHDMGIEQSLNKECGKFRHLNTRPEALSMYYLTAHYKAEVAQQTKLMSAINMDESNDHKESSKSRIQQNEDAVQAIVNIVNTRMTNPFLVEEGSSSENKQPLVNIFSSAVATPEITNFLCNV